MPHTGESSSGRCSSRGHNLHVSGVAARPAASSRAFTWSSSWGSRGARRRVSRTHRLSGCPWRTPWPAPSRPSSAQPRLHMRCSWVDARECTCETRLNDAPTKREISPRAPTPTNARAHRHGVAGQQRTGGAAVLCTGCALRVALAVQPPHPPQTHTAGGPLTTLGTRLQGRLDQCPHLHPGCSARTS